MGALEAFQAHRGLLFALAYRMLGSVADAEDVLQDAWLRFEAVPLESVRSPRAFLSTLVTRLCLNQLESARVRRESYVGPWLPEPIRTDRPEPVSGAAPPSERIEMLESISMAFLVLLEQLSPAERAVFLLHKVFDFPYDDIADMVGKDAATCRQLGSRAAKRIAEHRPRFRSAPDQHRRLLEQFMVAVGSGSYDVLIRLLTDDVTLWADGGGSVRGAATRPLHGRDPVARFVLSSTRFLPDGATPEIAEVNGEPAAILRVGESPVFVIAIAPRDERIAEIRVLGNPAKLRWLR
jgi:RNA polymerase sigma-70 factor (ECF subfamily)